MATRQRRLEIVIAWMQEHPGVVKVVQSQLRSLAGSYGYLKKSVGELNLTAGEQAVYTEELSKVYKAMRVRLGATAQTVNMMNKALKSTSDVFEEADKAVERAFGKMTKATAASTKETVKATKASSIFDKIMQRMGYRTSWVGFRMAIMGRLIMRSVLAPMQKMVGALSGWEKSMESVALALALQEAGMGETGLSAEELRQVLIDLATEGPKTQTAMQGLGATWDKLALENAPTLNTVIGEMQDALEGVGGAILTAMVDAVGDAVPALGDFLDLLDPFSDELGTFTGWLLLAGVAMTGIGTAIYLMKPALMTLKLMLNPIVVVLGTLIVMILLWKKYWGDWVGYMENVVFPTLDKLPNIAGFKALKELLDNLRVVGTAIGIIPREMEPAGAAEVSREDWKEMHYPGEVKQEIDVDVNIDIENILSEIDLDAMTTNVSNAVTEALRQRGWP